MRHGVIRYHGPSKKTAFPGKRLNLNSVVYWVAGSCDQGRLLDPVMKNIEARPNRPEAKAKYASDLRSPELDSQGGGPEDQIQT